MEHHRRESLVKVVGPVGWYAINGTRHALPHRMMLRRCETRPGQQLLGMVVPEPILVGLVGLHHGMTRLPPVRAGVLGRRGVATTHVAATRTSA